MPSHRLILCHPLLLLPAVCARRGQELMLRFIQSRADGAVTNHQAHPGKGGANPASETNFQKPESLHGSVKSQSFTYRCGGHVSSGRSDSRRPLNLQRDLYLCPSSGMTWGWGAGGQGPGGGTGASSDKNAASPGIGRAPESMTSFCKNSAKSTLKQTR